MSKINTSKFLLVFTLCIAFNCYALPPSNPLSEPIKIGFFSGHKTFLLSRVFIENYFDQESINVQFYSKFLNKHEFIEFPKSYTDLHAILVKDGKKTYFGKFSGKEVIEGIEKGLLHGGTVGEASFIEAVSNGSLIVAVAALAHDNKNYPLRTIFLRKDIKIKNDKDLIGKTFITRRSGPSHAIFLKEFFDSIGLDPQKDIKIIEQVDENKIEELFAQKKVDGGLLHISQARKLFKKNLGYSYRQMDWLNPEISQGLLVFSKEFVNNNPDKIVRFLKAYLKRIEYEKNLPIQYHTWLLIRPYRGKNLAIYEYPPTIKINLLDQMQELLIKYKITSQRVDLKDYINNDFVKEAAEKIESSQTAK